MKVTVTVTHNPLDDLLEISDDELDKIGLDLERELKLRSPVDTGNFRAAWNYDNATHTVVNNVEYGEALNAGHSKQAPAGFVEAAIDAVTRL